MMSRRGVIGAALLVGGSGQVSASQSATGEAQTRFAFEARVTVGTPLVIGDSAHGLRRVVPITGGTFEGPRLKGRVVPGGADWQVVRPDGVLAIEAKYTLQTHDGALIMVTNRGMRHGPKDVIDKLASGVAVDPRQYYFRTSAEFEAPSDGAYGWLNRAVFLGVAERNAGAAIIRFHEVL